MNLVEYLAQLNTCENQWSLWVNPENPDEYRVGQNIFENGGVLDGYINIGSLDSLSFGYQSITEALESYLNSCGNEILYQGKKVKINSEAILEAYQSSRLSSDFELFLKSQAEEICETWAQEEADGFVENKLPKILEDYEECRREQELIDS